MNLINKHILIVGLGISGIAAAKFAKNRGAIVTITDKSEPEALEPYMSRAQGLGITVEQGQHNLKTFEQADLVVISPGVPHNILPLQHVRSMGIPVIGEIELAARFIDKPVIAVSGTNGKTTTTTLLGDMLEESGFKVFVGGNIGKPLIGHADRNENVDIIVAEVSSFQLDTIDTFRPKVGVLLNITEDHMDRYKNFKDYVLSKSRIFKNMGKSDFAVFNGFDPAVLSVAGSVEGGRLPFYYDDNGEIEITEGAIIKENKSTGSKYIRIKIKDYPQKKIDLTGVHIKGRHNYENIAAAALAAFAIGGTRNKIQSALNRFKGLPHRMEHIAEIKGINFFNDSKATNIDAVAKALETFNKPVILILGGRHKGGDMKALEGPVKKHVKKMIVLGEARGIIKAVLEEACPGGAQMADSMDDAVHNAFRSAAKGDIVLLSPACSSFDMYKNYAKRGESFCQAVKGLKQVG